MSSASWLFGRTEDTTYSNLKKMILLREVEPGQRLSETFLAERFGVSRMPIRVALRQLSRDGLVVMIPHNGTWVASPTKEEILDAYELRTELECIAATKAARNATPDAVKHLWEKLENISTSFAERDIESFLSSNAEFHLGIAKASGSQILLEYVENILYRTFQHKIFFEDFWNEAENRISEKEHRALVEEIKNRNEKLCVKLMIKHLKRPIVILNLEN